MIEQRHGSPDFYKLLQEMADTHDKKSHDYASNANPFGNYHFAGSVAALFSHSPEDAGFAGRVAEKLYRLSVLEGQGKVPKNESIVDTEVDICTIVVLWMTSRREMRKKAELRKQVIDRPVQQNVKQEIPEGVAGPDGSSRTVY